MVANVAPNAIGSASPSPMPFRNYPGFTQDPSWLPMGVLGIPDPFFYHAYYDDFDYLDTQLYTSTNGSTGSIAMANGDGGVVAFTTAATINDFEVLQTKNAGFNFAYDNISVATNAISAAGSFVLSFATPAAPTALGITIGQFVQSVGANTIPAGYYVSGINVSGANTLVTIAPGPSATVITGVGSATITNGQTVYFGSPIKKTVFIARIKSSLLQTTMGFLTGLVNVTAAPFTAANITDGVYLQKTAGSTVLTLFNVANGIVTSAVVPASIYNLINNQYLDVAISVDRNGVIYGAIGLALVGYTNNSGSGNNASSAPGAVGQARCMNFSFNSINGVNPQFTVQNLAPIIAVNTSAGVATVGTADFMGAFRER
jgi:hypothetical protein